MFGWMADGNKTLAAAILMATVLTALMFRYETLGTDRHRNRFTGVVCPVVSECWISSDSGSTGSTNSASSGSSQRRSR